MQKFELTKKDLTEFYELIEISKSIKTLTFELCSLENDNLKNTSDFEKTLDYLKIAIQVEDEKCKKLFSSENECKKWLNFLKEEKGKKVKENEIIRIHNELMYRIYFNLNSTDFISSFYLACENDNINSFLLMLDDIILRKKDSSYSSSIIKLKYGIIYTHRDIERILLGNKYDVPKAIPSEAKYIAKLWMLDDDNYSLFNNEFHKIMAMHAIEKILMIKDSDIDKASFSFSIMSYVELLKANLLLLDNENIKEVYNQYQDLISKKYLYDADCAKTAISLCFDTSDELKNNFYSADIEYQKKI